MLVKQHYGKTIIFGGAIRDAGTVKGKKTGKFATSDWMEIEKQRGISVTSSVMQFDYDGPCQYFRYTWTPRFQ